MKRSPYDISRENEPDTILGPNAMAVAILLFCILLTAGVICFCEFFQTIRALVVVQ